MAQSLEILIATHGNNGLKEVAKQKLPKVDGVRYIVTWQKPGIENYTVPSELDRDDMIIVKSEETGLCRNRNTGIRNSTADVCLITDNDVDFTKEQIAYILTTYNSHPDVDVCMFRFHGTLKTYPKEECSLSDKIPPNYDPASIEISFRREQIVRHNLHFNEQFGMGAPYGLGEEALFLHDCRKAGLNCRFFPFDICSHLSIASGARPFTSHLPIVGTGLMIRRLYGLKGWPRIYLFGLRNRRNGRIRHLLSGWYWLTRGFFMPRSKQPW